jgi:arabinofuranosyltransferase
VIWLLIGTAALFPIVSGGDHMAAFRFCLVLVPLLATVLVLHLSRSGLLANAPVLAGFIGVLIVSLVLQKNSSDLNPRTTDPAAKEGRIIGEYIQTHWRPGSVVALNTAGSTPYYADGMQYIDMLGLNDAQIARRKDIPSSGPWTRLIGHLKGDGANVLSRRPNYIILGPSEGTTPELQEKVYFLGDYEIGRSPIFQRDYELCVVPMVDGPKFSYYQRRDAGEQCPVQP